MVAVERARAGSAPGDRRSGAPRATRFVREWPGELVTGPTAANGRTDFGAPGGRGAARTPAPRAGPRGSDRHSGRPGRERGARGAARRSAAAGRRPRAEPRLAACGQSSPHGNPSSKRWGAPSSGRMRGAFPTGWRPESLARSVPPSFAGREDPPRRRFAPRRRTRDFLHSLPGGGRPEVGLRGGGGFRLPRAPRRWLDSVRGTGDDTAPGVSRRESSDREAGAVASVR